MASQKIVHVLPDFRKRLTCTLCQNEFIWDSESSWYGCWESRNGHIEVEQIMCSKKCRKEFESKLGQK